MLNIHGVIFIGSSIRCEIFTVLFFTESGLTGTNHFHTDMHQDHASKS